MASKTVARIDFNEVSHNLHCSMSELWRVISLLKGIRATVELSEQDEDCIGAVIGLAVIAEEKVSAIHNALDLQCLALAHGGA